MTDERDRNHPTQKGPRDQAHLDAQSQLRNDSFTTAPHQTGDLDAAADRDRAAGERTGSARRAEEASGEGGGPRTADDAERVLRDTSGDREERSQGKRGRD